MPDTHQPDTTPDEASIAQRIGIRLRTLRTGKGLTLAELSRQSGVSVSYLSAVEKGVNLPSLQTLARLTESLGVSIPSVLAEEGRPHVHLAGVPATPGTVGASHPLLQLTTAITRTSSSTSGPAPVPVAERDLFLYVVEGAVAVTLDDRRYELGAGDAIDAHCPDSVTYQAQSDCVIVWSSSPARIG
ncbi:helix-turn-helix domain-containing protein [Nakamurella silvestris]|nr:helix-turn-helix domain-containing protein [Nakamurella silvestris]